jgi:ribosomal protein S18 acetylase RimI-like enzyme
MLSVVIDVRMVGPDDWRTWRMLRLAALADAPYAFGSVLADWQGTGDREERWRSRLALAGAHNLVAHVDGEPAGMASGVPAESADEGEAVEVISMWVAPAARGRGVADLLLREVEQWARTRGAAVMRLAVALGNDAARRLYERHGYVDTGLREVMPDGRRREAVLAKPLRPAPAPPA